MMTAYSEDMLEHSKMNLGEAFDYAINCCLLDASQFGDMFRSSRYSELFGDGAPHVTVGMSGTELATLILNDFYKGKTLPQPRKVLSYTPEFWAGWTLAEYQWRSCRPFKRILEKIPLDEIVEMYYSYSEDPEEFFKRMDEIFHEWILESRLKRYRCGQNLSQSELAELSGVKLRSIQMWEQRANNIDKAQVHSLYRLAHVLGCSMEDLLEDPIYCGEIHLDQGE